MFDKFGEFDSAEEMNKAAAGLKAEGDIKSLKALAVENGLDPEDAEDYLYMMDGIFVSPLMAALGKLEIEEAELKIGEILKDWTTYIKQSCEEDPVMAVAVRKKGKSLKGCLAALLKWSFKNMTDLPKDLVKEAGVSANRVALGIPGMATAKKIITAYYLGR